MTNIQPGDLVRISYTGRLLKDGSLFESTDEETARKGGIWSTASTYGPRLSVFGKGAMIKGIEEAVLTLNPGQSGTFKIEAEKAFGPKFPELIRLMPESEFAKGGVRPQAGLMVMVEGLPAVVKSVGSGRVTLDFNHPFSGQDIEYAITLLDVVTDPAEKARALSEHFGISVRIEKDGEKNRIAIQSGADRKKAASLSAALSASLGNWAEIAIDRQK